MLERLRVEFAKFLMPEEEIQMLTLKPVEIPGHELVTFARNRGFSGIDVGIRVGAEIKNGQKPPLVLRVFVRERDQKIPNGKKPAWVTTENGEDAQVVPETNFQPDSIKPMESVTFKDDPSEMDLGIGSVFPIASNAENEISNILKDLANKAEIEFDPESDLEILSMQPELQQLKPRSGIFHQGSGRGTVTAIVYQNRTGKPMILSCWHVLANHWSSDDFETYELERLQGSTEYRMLGRLVYSTLLPDARGDVAVSRLEANIDFNTQHEWYPKGGNVQKFKIEESRRLGVGDIGKPMQMVSFSTGDNIGVIDGIGTYFLDFKGSIGVVGINGFRVVPQEPNSGIELSKPGDSGALRYMDGKNGKKVGVGIHFAGEPANGNQYREYALASHLDNALEKLGVSLTQAAALGSRSPNPRQSPSVRRTHDTQEVATTQI